MSVRTLPLRDDAATPEQVLLAALESVRAGGAMSVLVLLEHDDECLEWLASTQRRETTLYLLEWAKVRLMAHVCEDETSGG